MKISRTKRNKYALPEIVRDKGFIVGYNDYLSTIKNTIDKAMTSKRNGRKRIQDNFSLRRRKKEIVEIINELV